MTINYSDFTNGNDTTGDGSAGNPYKTITKASTGLTGGDEVRVAKSPAASNLTGTLGFTLNSTAVTGSGTSFTTELAIGDFIKGGDGNWWEVITITDNTNATLYKKYSGSTGSGVSSQKLGVTSTGEAAATTTTVQAVSASGSSSASMLKISGGWDLAGPTQDGQTYFRQMHGTFANRYGYGLYVTDKSFVEIERCHFLRYNYGIYIYNNNRTNTITSPTCNSNIVGIYIYTGSHNNTLISPVCNSNNYGIYLAYNSNNTITSPTCNSNARGIYIYRSHNNTVTSSTCNSNSDNGFRFYACTNNTIVSPTCNNNLYGLYSSAAAVNNVVIKFSGSGNTYNTTWAIPSDYNENPAIKLQHYGSVGNDRCYFCFGRTYKNTANARSTQCINYRATDATYYISQSFFFKADSGVAQSLSAWIKKEAAFNGDVQGAIYFMSEKITGWTAITPSAADTYEQKSLVAASGDVTEDGVLELKIKVRGTAGNVYVDDLGSA